MPRIQLGSFHVDETSLPYIIAEIGVNHEGSLETAVRLIDQAKAGGAHAAKFQSYKAHTLASKHSPAYWDLKAEKTTSQFELFKKYDSFGPDEYLHLSKHCQKIGIDFLSTPFDREAIDFLEPLVPFYKVASADLTNIPFLRAIGRKQKPVVLSTGASRIDEIDTAIEELVHSGCPSLALLHCVLNYPTRYENANLAMITDLKSKYPQYIIGYSDHTLPDHSMSALCTAYTLGARIIEKHFTHDKTLPGNDHYHAMNEADLKVFVTDVTRVRTMLGASHKAPLASEQPARHNARRSVVLEVDLPTGTILGEHHLTTKRPGLGIAAAHWDKVIGLKINQDLKSDDVLTWSAVEQSNDRGKVVAVIQARMGSSRFPGKMVARLAGRPLLSWLIERTKRAAQIDEVVLATTNSPEDDALVEIAETYHIPIVRGSQHDVLERITQAAEKHRADIVIRICGDNPFVDPDELDRLVSYFRLNWPDYAFNHIPRLNNQYADGFGAEILPFSVLKGLHRTASQPSHREHVTSYIWDNPSLFNIGVLVAPIELQRTDLRFDVDAPADLERLAPFAEKLGVTGKAVEYIRAQSHI
jgi:sialic acid synthase SpsE/spore coat polysaccharide biosynthesis protein SpsF (cytidylyltransferase family)